MNYFLRIFFLYIFVHSKSIVESMINQEIGGICTSDGLFFIESFNVNPWPPTAGKFSTIYFPGVSEGKITIGIIEYSIENENQAWYTTLQTVNQTYLQDESTSFTNIIQWPFFSGEYNFQMRIHGQTHPENIHACWTFSFILY
ncbi:hypothetical protein SteCoe_26109 [Stentor coeruleus]|uniref:Uncharacterized protein n=1 Tax=Stentor coeruleus TaxID=5963 RepID=A0A1R2BDN7_9CILI|nr:hypothetical protein SteCoe_26109 [Stentor coeruleus]